MVREDLAVNDRRSAVIDISPGVAQGIAVPRVDGCVDLFVSGEVDPGRGGNVNMDVWIGCHSDCRRAASKARSSRAAFRSDPYVNGSRGIIQVNLVASCEPHIRDVVVSRPQRDIGGYAVPHDTG